MATTRMAYGAVLGTVTDVASTISSSFNTVNNSFTMLNNYVKHELGKQEVRQADDLFKFEQTSAAETAKDIAATQEEISSWCQANPTRQALFDQALTDLKAARLARKPKPEIKAVA